METATLHALFIRCMRAFLKNKTVSALDLTPQEWGKLYHLAKRQNLAGALFAVTQGQPIPDAVRDRLRRDSFLTLTAFETQSLMVKDITAALTEREIAPLFFKGAVVRRYYPDPALRCMGDIDLLIHAQDMSRARSALEAAGFTCTSDRGEVWVYARNGYFVEVHSRVEMYDVHKQDTVAYANAWVDARRRDNGSYRWSHETEAVFALSHLVKHFCSEGCGLRQLMDVAVLYTKNPDRALWERVIDRLVPYGTQRFARHILYLCRVWFGIPIPDTLITPLSEAMTAAMMERLLSDGVLGTDVRLLLAAERKERQLAKKGGKLGYMVRWVFPSADDMRKRYRYAQRSALLLPAAYAHRTLEAVTTHRHKHQKRLQYARDHRDTLDEEVQFFKDIGL